MAKGGKKSSAKKATAKQLPSLPVPPEMARWASEVARWLGQWKRDNEDYWAKNPPADWTDPSIWRFLAERDLRPRARAEEVAPKKQK